ncbi:hypothetical protein DFA_08756 [Cavenderia fasciculata]|uniref:Uncharacterized protein n=1 Tax=Cavenderia fasciculata TaxID=261658 RepID=F4Q455_CACFS|nr:hypothetical protein DFA_08756 [Cavenderia fasciculata]EGG17757.1 hypothetical protein DFA_08756 [Cavenderia fasciculata]|eukprot:XP_004356241.1 hypothetical protein DFA_08756 [Cavenderia fasciculata]
MIAMASIECRSDVMMKWGDMFVSVRDLK